MKILMVSDHYEPYIIGGAETHLQILARELKARGHSVSVATARIGGDPERETRSGIPVLRIGDFPSYRRTFLMASGTAPGRVDDRIRGDFLRALAEVEPDVVHFHNVWMLGPELISLAHGRKGLTVHDYWPVCPRRSLIRVDWSLCPGPARVACRICRLRAPTTLRSFNLCSIEAEREQFGRLLRECNFVAAGTHYVSDRVHSILGIRPHVVAYGIAPAVPSIAEKKDVSFALFAGRVTKAKGYPLLLKAFSRAELRSHELWIAGRAGRSPLPNVRVLGWHEPEALFRLMAQAACVVLPSIWPEPAGIVLLEAIRAGTPVVASRIGGIPELVDDGVTGILVPPGDVSALASAIRRCFEDGALRESTQRLGPEIIRNRFSLQEKISQWEGLYAGTEVG